VRHPLLLTSTSHPLTILGPFQLHFPNAHEEKKIPFPLVSERTLDTLTNFYSFKLFCLRNILDRKSFNDQRRRALNLKPVIMTSVTSSKRLVYTRKGTLSPLLVCADSQTSEGGEDAIRVPLQKTSVPSRISCRTREHHKTNEVSNSPRESLRRNRESLRVKLLEGTFLSIPFDSLPTLTN
jgi:hypothetical protein